MGRAFNWQEQNGFRRSFSAAAATVAISELALRAASASISLPQFNSDKTQTSVPGLSSGGFMALQLHVAYSATFKKERAVQPAPFLLR